MKIRGCSAWERRCCAYSTKLLVLKKLNDWLVVTSFLHLTDLPIRHLLFKGNSSYFKSLGITGTVSETMMEKYSSEERPNISLQLPLRILDLSLSLFFLQLNKTPFICDIQIQPVQKEITFAFDPCDNKLLKKKKKVYIYIKKKFIFEIFSKETLGGVKKKNHKPVIYTSDISRNNLRGGKISKLIF